MTSLFKIENGRLKKAPKSSLEQEKLIEDWVFEDPSLLGLDALIIGRQVATDHGKYIDLLALERSGNIVIIELKKDKTPRDVVAQVLDYASWVRTITTPQVYEISARMHPNGLAGAFRDQFGDVIPERLNGSHMMLIVASELDAASKRIVEYLSEEHGVSINTAFFNIFSDGNNKWLTTDFLLDQSEVEERSDRKIRPPWSGFYYVNAGIGEDRSWNDMRKFGFIGACGGEFYTKRLDQLKIGDRIFVHDKGRGYIGSGIVTEEKTLASAFKTPLGLLFEQKLEQPNIKRNADNPDLAEYVVGIKWNKTFELHEAQWFKGAFANQNIVCKLRDPATVEFLISAFEASD